MQWHDEHRPMTKIANPFTHLGRACSQYSQLEVIHALSQLESITATLAWKDGSFCSLAANWSKGMVTVLHQHDFPKGML